tara:strand:- start:1622 stop:1972 length:351 start_codon:yes stop_codon:yes gene_type:complete
MFAAVAYSANCYSKNATIALLAGLFVSNFVFGCNQVKESFVDAKEPGAKIKKMLGKMKDETEKEQVECKDDDEREECQQKIEKFTDIMTDLTAAGKMGTAQDAMTNIVSALKNMGK